LLGWRFLKEQVVVVVEVENSGYDMAKLTSWSRESESEGVGRSCLSTP
jgi:hypothetical protein